jgi:hypothetical protein
VLPAAEHSRHGVESQASLLLERAMAGEASFSQQRLQRGFIIARQQAGVPNLEPSESQESSQNKSKPWDGALENHVSDREQNSLSQRSGPLSEGE